MLGRLSISAAGRLRHRVTLAQQAVASRAGVPIEQRPAPLETTDLFHAIEGLPDIRCGELTADHLASGILHHGGLVVRGVLAPRQIDALRRHLDEDESSSCVCMTPEAVVELLAAYRPLAGVLGEYLGEPPVSLLQRTRLKRDVSKAGLRWHQDAPLFGGPCRAVNFWTALTPVGERCPGLSLLPQRIEGIIAPDYDIFDHSDRRGDDAVRELSRSKSPVSPVLAPGDSIVFDEMTLHQTQITKWDDDRREVAVTWFFAPSRFPVSLGKKKQDCTPVALDA